MSEVNVDIKGYRQLTESEQQFINEIKQAEIEVAELYRICMRDGDKRWASIGKTHLQQGFSALVRSIAQPQDVYE